VPFLRLLTLSRYWMRKNIHNQTCSSEWLRTYLGVFKRPSRTEYLFSLARTYVLVLPLNTHDTEQFMHSIVAMQTKVRIMGSGVDTGCRSDMSHSYAGRILRTAQLRLRQTPKNGDRICVMKQSTGQSIVMSNEFKFTTMHAR
jgi:hypothetical protein